jgi:alkanesulfonate monooxygenase SsuD/methylene tetrahydromethanopterin reductase-like flavin-dependent oxidoreductase (luciferase family)
MRVGMKIFCQNADDWDRYLAEERGESVPRLPAISDRDIFLEEVGLAIEADSLGFDSVWTVEHHFTPYTMVTNPLQVLTYLAGRTENVDLGTAVIVLPWHNPVRVAEDIVMLDTLLGDDRRVYAGLGRGLGRREFKGLSVDQNESRGRFDESLEIIRRLLATGEIDSFNGEFWQLDGLRLRPKPTEDLSDRVYAAAGSPSTMEILAKLGVNPLIIPNTDLESALTGMQRYMQVREESGFEPTHTKLVMWAYCAENEDDARKVVDRYMPAYADTAMNHYEFAAGHLANVKGYESYAASSAELLSEDAPWRRMFIEEHPWGTPEMCIEKATRQAHRFGVDEIVFVFKYGGMPLELAEESMRLFAREVVPALNEIQPTYLEPAAV